MANKRDEAPMPEVQGSTTNAHDVSSVTSAAAAQASDAAAWGSQAAMDQFERARAWSGERPGRTMSLGAAALVALGASAVTAIVIRRRAESRADKRMAWLSTRAGGLMSSMPSMPSMPTARQAAPFGGAGGALLMAALLAARMRQSQSHSRMDELNQRLAELESQASSHLPYDPPRPRDLVLGAVIAFALTKLVSRFSPRPPK